MPESSWSISVVIASKCVSAQDTASRSEDCGQPAIRVGTCGHCCQAHRVLYLGIGRYEAQVGFAQGVGAMRKSAARISAFDDLVFSSQLGRLVRERRREQGLSQEHVVELTNGLITQNWLSKLETGEYLTAPVGKLQALSVA